MIAAVYAHKSTDQNADADEAKSVTGRSPTQRAYATRKGWTVPETCIFVDDGFSGAEFARRPGVQRLRAALKPRPSFQVLVVSEQSRLSRDTAETRSRCKDSRGPVSACSRIRTIAPSRSTLPRTHSSRR